MPLHDDTFKDKSGWQLRLFKPAVPELRMACSLPASMPIRKSSERYYLGLNTVLV